MSRRAVVKRAKLLLGRRIDGAFGLWFFQWLRKRDRNSGRGRYRPFDDHVNAVYGAHARHR